MTPSQPQPPTNSSSPLNRRRFLAGTSASVLAFTVLKPSLLRGAEANSKVNLGLIGCGGRGRWIGGFFQKHGGYNLVALADYFQDHVDEAGEKLNVPAARRFTGLAGYRRLLEQKLDAVVIETPPYFHPEQAAAAVDAGKHVYLAKPVAVDVPGCLTVAESGQKAAARKLSFLVDFQTRACKVHQDAVKAVHDGEIGKIISAEAAYHCGPTWERMDQVLRKDPKNPEVRLRAWGVDRELSGDVITEQNIHALDLTCWLLNAEPLRAYGTGGRTRDFVGNCWDHFACVFYFPNNVVVSFNSTQAGYGYDDIMCRVFGLKGTADVHYSDRVLVNAKELRTEGKVPGIYAEGVENNVATFHRNITTGDPAGNPTVPASVRSNLTTILGRMAAYKNGVVTWKEMMRRKERFVPDLKGLKA